MQSWLPGHVPRALQVLQGFGKGQSVFHELGSIRSSGSRYLHIYVKQSPRIHMGPSPGVHVARGVAKFGVRGLGTACLWLVLNHD